MFETFERIFFWLFAIAVLIGGFASIGQLSGISRSQTMIRQEQAVIRAEFSAIDAQLSTMVRMQSALGDRLSAAEERIVAIDAELEPIEFFIFEPNQQPPRPRRGVVVCPADEC